MSKKIRPLTKEEQRLLLDTRWDDLTKVFKGWPRRWLHEQQKKLRAEVDPMQLVDVDRERAISRAKEVDLDRRYRALMQENERLRSELEASMSMPTIEPKDLRIEGKPGEREATAVVLASDWHCEEEVRTESTNGLNVYNLSVFDERARWFFKNTAKLLHKEAKSINVRNLILAVLGDMISGNIHRDVAASCQLGPMDAIALAQDTIAAGIRALLKETGPSVTLWVPVKPGNHSRVTDEQLISNEHENALEWLMAHNLAREFRSEPRVKIIRERSLLTYLDVHGFKLRFTHGHAFKYAGGVGGITIPVLKKIAQWDKGIQADLTCFGHVHTYFPGPNFVANGSLIGYAPFGEWVGAAFEPPRQAFFLVDAKHGRTVQTPVILEDA